MKHFPFLVYLVLGAAACSPPEREEVRHYPSGEIKYRVALNEKVVYTGTFTRFYSSAVKKQSFPSPRAM